VLFLHRLEERDEVLARQCAVKTNEWLALGREDEECGHILNTEAVGQLGLLIDVNVHGSPMAQDLGHVGAGEDIAVHLAAGATPRGMELEKDELVSLGRVGQGPVEIIEPGECRRRSRSRRVQVEPGHADDAQPQHPARPGAPSVGQLRLWHR